MTYPNRWRTRPLGYRIECDYVNCAFGMGQAGNGRCPGDWTKPGQTCPEFVTPEDFDRQQEEKAKEARLLAAMRHFCEGLTVEYMETHKAKEAL